MPRKQPAWWSFCFFAASTLLVFPYPAFTHAQEDETTPLTKEQIAEFRQQVSDAVAKWEPIIKELSTEEPLEADDVSTDIQRTLKQYEDSAIPEIGKLLEHDNWEVRRLAAKWFSSGHDDVQLAADKLKVALRDPVWKVRLQAMESLDYLTEYDDKIFIPEIVASLADPHQEVSDKAVEALCGLKSRAIIVKEQLLKVFKERGDNNYGSLSIVFGMMGTEGKDAIPYIVKAMEDTYNGGGVAKALGQTGARTELFRMLQSEWTSQRGYALSGMGWLPDADENIVQRLIDATVNDPEPEARAEAAVSLGRITPATEKASDAIVKLLSHEEAYLRVKAAEALGLIEPKFDTAIEALIQASKDSVESVRDSASESLSKYKMDSTTQSKVLIGKVIQDNRFGYGNDFREREAEFYQPLLDIAADKSNEAGVRSTALYIVAIMARNYESQVKDRRTETIRVLKDHLSNEEENLSVRGTAAIGLDYLRAEEPPLNQGLIMALENAEPTFIRQSAASCIADDEIEELIPDLIKALAQSDSTAVEGACYALRRFEKKAANAIPKLSEIAASDADSDVRESALDSIGQIATNLEKAIPVLVQLLGDKESDLQMYAANTIRDIARSDDPGSDLEVFVEPLHNLLKETDGWSEKVSSINALGAIGTKAAPAFETLFQYVNSDEETSLREYAVEAIGRLGEASRPAENRLIALMEVEGIEKEALQSLSRLKMGTNHGMMKINELLDDLSERHRAFELIGNYGDQAGAAIPKLKAIMENPDTQEKQQVLQAVAKMGKTAEPLLPHVRKWMTDEKEWIRREARDTALQISPDNTDIVLEAFGSFEINYQEEAAVEFLKSASSREIVDWLKLARESDNEKARSNALQLLPKYADASQMADLWTQSLSDPDAQVQLTAAINLSNAGNQSPEILNALVNGLTIGYEQPWSIYRAIRPYGRKAGASIADLLIQGDLDSDANAQLVESLSQFRGNNAYQARFKLQRAMMSMKDSDQHKTWVTLGWAQLISGNRAQVISDTLANAIDADDDALQRAAVTVITNHANMSESVHDSIATPLLKRLIADHDEKFIDYYYILNSIHLTDSHAEILADVMEKNPTAGLAVAANKTAPKNLTDAALKLFLTDDNLRYDAQQALFERQFDASSLIQFMLDPEKDSTDREMAADVLCSLKLSPEDIAKFSPQIKTLLDDSELGKWATVLLVFWDQMDDNVAKTVPNLLSIDVYSQCGRRFEEARKQIPDQYHSELTEQVKRLLNEEKIVEDKFPAFRFLLDYDQDKAAICRLAYESMKEAEEYSSNDYAYLLQRHRVHSIPTILELVKDAEPTAAALDFLRPFVLQDDLTDAQTQEAMAIIKRGLESEDRVIQVKSALLMPSLDPTDKRPLPILLEAIKGEGQDYTLASAISLIESVGESDVNQILSLLENPDNTYFVINAVSQLGERAKPAIPKLVELLDSPEYRNSAFHGLGTLGVHAADAAPELLKRIRTDSSPLAAASALQKMEPHAKQAAEILKERFGDPDQKYEAVLAVGYLGEDGASLVPTLIRAFETRDTELTLMVLKSLTRLGQHAKSSAQPVSELAIHPDPEVRENVAITLGKIKTAEIAVPVLSKLVLDRDLQTRRMACSSLRSYAAESADAVENLTKLLDSKSLDDRLSAIGALTGIGKKAAAAIPKLKSLYENIDSSSPKYYRTELIRAIWMVDPDMAKAMQLEPK